MKLCESCRFSKVNGNECPIERTGKDEHCNFYKSDVETKEQRKKRELAVLHARLNEATSVVEYLKKEIAIVGRS